MLKKDKIDITDFPFFLRLCYDFRQYCYRACEEGRRGDGRRH